TSSEMYNLSLHDALPILLVCGLFAGSYPALYLSAFNPLATLKSVQQKAGLAGFIRRGLVILQYTSAVVLIICTSIIYQQISHAKDRKSTRLNSSHVKTSY